MCSKSELLSLSESESDIKVLTSLPDTATSTEGLSPFLVVLSGKSWLKF